MSTLDVTSAMRHDKRHYKHIRTHYNFTLCPLEVARKAQKEQAGYVTSGVDMVRYSP